MKHSKTRKHAFEKKSGSGRTDDEIYKLIDSVMPLLNKGVSIQSACIEKGISPSTFYNIQRTHPKAWEKVDRGRNNIKVLLYEKMHEKVEKGDKDMIRYVGNAKLNKEGFGVNRIAISETEVYNEEEKDKINNEFKNLYEDKD